MEVAGVSRLKSNLPSLFTPSKGDGEIGGGISGVLGTPTVGCFLTFSKHK